jgi:hypothetical protein
LSLGLESLLVGDGCKRVDAATDSASNGSFNGSFCGVPSSADESPAGDSNGSLSLCVWMGEGCVELSVGSVLSPPRRDTSSNILLRRSVFMPA